MVEIKCSGAGTRKLEDLVYFQGDLKSLSKEAYNKFKSQILELGLIETINIWPERNLIANGHQRLRVLLQMKKEGIKVPEDIPVSYTHPKDEHEFAKFVLSLCSLYGKIERQGTYEYCIKHNIKVEFIENKLILPNLNAPRFKQEFFTDPTTEKVSKTVNKQLKCPECGHEWKAQNSGKTAS